MLAIEEQDGITKALINLVGTVKMAIMMDQVSSEDGTLVVIEDALLQAFDALKDTECPITSFDGCIDYSTAEMLKTLREDVDEMMPEYKEMLDMLSGIITVAQAERDKKAREDAAKNN